MWREGDYSRRRVAGVLQSVSRNSPRLIYLSLPASHKSGQHANFFPKVSLPSSCWILHPLRVKRLSQMLERVVFFCMCVCALPDQACWSHGVRRESWLLSLDALWAQVTGGHPAKSGITFRLGVGYEEEREKMQRLRGDGQQ